MEFISKEIFGKYSKKKILALTFFFRPSTLKTDFFPKNLMVAYYVHIQESTYQFSGESKGVEPLLLYIKRKDKIYTVYTYVYSVSMKVFFSLSEWLYENGKTSRPY